MSERKDKGDILTLKRCFVFVICFLTDRQDLEESEKVDILQEPMLEALKVRL